MVIYYGYLGFDSVAAVAEETVNPSKTIPKSIIHSVVAIIFIYFLVSFTFSGVGDLTKY